MGLVVFAWLIQQQYFKDMTDLDIRKQMYKDQMKAMEDDMLPFGIIDTGIDDGIDNIFTTAALPAFEQALNESGNPIASFLVATQAAQSKALSMGVTAAEFQAATSVAQIVFENS